METSDYPASLPSRGLRKLFFAQNRFYHKSRNPRIATRVKIQRGFSRTDLACAQGAESERGVVAVIAVGVVGIPIGVVVRSHDVSGRIHVRIVVWRVIRAINVVHLL